MTEQTFRPSIKTTIAGYLCVALIVAAAIWLYFYVKERPLWAPVIAGLLFLLPLRMHLQRLAVKLSLDDAHLRLEKGLLSKTTRTLALARVQDVTVRQTLMQRILGVGDVSVETAGEGSAMTAESFDRPKELADRVLQAAHGSGGAHPTSV